MATLVIRTGARSGDRVAVDGSLVIGRADADLVVDDPEVSRRHAVIRRAGETFELEDLGSRNGTRVEGEVITHAVLLHDGATIQIGQTELEFESAPEPAATVVSQHSPPSATAAAEATSGSSLFGAPPADELRSAGVASRQLGAILLTYSLIVAVTAALVVYFWQHG